MIKFLDKCVRIVLSPPYLQLNTDNLYIFKLIRKIIRICVRHWFNPTQIESIVGFVYDALIYVLIDHSIHIYILIYPVYIYPTV